MKVNDTNRVLDKKLPGKWSKKGSKKLSPNCLGYTLHIVLSRLRRVFNFIDTDMDGYIPQVAVISVVSKLKAG